MKISYYSKFEALYFRLEKAVEYRIRKLSIRYSRVLANKYRREVVKRNGRSVITKELKANIKEYALERFGETAYWTWIALYTEVRGEFIKGWIPHDYFRYILLPKFNPKRCCEISEQKTFDYRLFGDFAIRPLFLYVSGMILNPEFEVIANSQVREFFSNFNDTIVIKEELGTKGKQVKFIHSTEFVPEMLSENVNYIIQPYVRQYHVLEALNPESLNTFRVTTFLKKDGTVDIKFVVLRFGVAGSRVDNISSGGQFIYFDSFGRPSKYSYDIKGANTGDRHITTGYRFSNIDIPMH